MMKRILSFLLCLIMVVGIVAPSVQASGTGNSSSPNILDGIYIPEDSEGTVIVNGEDVTEEVKNNTFDNLPSPGEMTTPTTAPSTPVAVDLCKCVDLSTAEDHSGVCKVKAPYMQACEASADELCALWGGYTAEEQAFMLEYLQNNAAVKYDCFMMLLTAPTGSASETYVDGTTVSVEGIPQDGSLTIGEATNEVKDIVDAYVAVNESASTELFTYDVSVQDGDGADWQPDAMVKMELELPGEKLHKYSKVYVVHVDDNGVATTIEAEVTEDGKIAFETPGFSTFAGFTVDFNYEGVRFSIPGMSSIKLSELFDNLKMPLNAEDVINVEYTDDTQLKIEQLDGDWLLTSLKAFTTEETLTLTMADGTVYQIKVTDDIVGQRADSYFAYAGYTGNTCYVDVTYGSGNSHNGVVSLKVSDNTGKGITTEDNKSSYYANSHWWERRFVIDGSGIEDNFSGGALEICIEKNGTGNYFKVPVVNWLIKDGATVNVYLQGFDSDDTISFESWIDGSPLITIDDGTLYFNVEGSVLPQNAATPSGYIYNFQVTACSYKEIILDGYDNVVDFEDAIIFAEVAADNLYINDVKFIKSNRRAVYIRADDMKNCRLDNCIFDSTISCAAGGGGAIYIAETTGADGSGGWTDVANFELYNCEFDQNASTGRGGAILIWGNMNITKISNCSFYKCKPAQQGGAVSIGDKENTFNMGNITFEDCTFEEMSSGDSLGGAVWLNQLSNNVTFDGCTFTKIEAQSHGGALHIGGDSDTPVPIASLELKDCTFTSCKALNGRGGALRLITSSTVPVTITDCSFDGCTASSNGGALSFQGNLKSLTISGTATDKSKFNNCSAGSRGGAICFELPFSGTDAKMVESVSISGTSFVNCIVNQDSGGAIWHRMWTNDLDITNCSFSGGSAPVYGGAIDLIGKTGTADIVGCSFSNCKAGAVISPLYVKDAAGNNTSTPVYDKKGNQMYNGSGGGGAICISENHGDIRIAGTNTGSTINYSTFSNCETLNNGGAIDVEGNVGSTHNIASLTIEYVFINGCSARDSGTAMCFGSLNVRTMDIKNSKVENCHYVRGYTGADALKNTLYQEDVDNGLDYDDIAFRSNDSSGTIRTVGAFKSVTSIENVRFYNNISATGGGGIYWNANRRSDSVTDKDAASTFEASLIVKNCEFESNECLRDGGAIYVEASLTVEGGSFKNNLAERGGAIAQQLYNNSDRPIQPGEKNNLIITTYTSGTTTKGAVFDENYAKEHGGALSLLCNATSSITTTENADAMQYPITCKILSAEMKNNRAGQNGGAVNFYQMSYPADYTASQLKNPTTGADLTEEEITAKAVLDNKEVEGYIKSLILDGSSIHGNYSGCGKDKLTTPEEANGSGNGGGVYLKAEKKTTLKILGCEIYSNTAHDGNGGGVYMTGLEGKCTIGLSELFKDTKGQWLKTVIGGAADKTNKAIRVSDDQNKGLGGGIAILDNARIEMESGTVSYNEATTAGGGIAVHKQSSMWFTDGTVEYNKSINGGGISLNAAKALNAGSSKDEEKYGMFLDGGDVKNNKVIAPTDADTAYGGGICISASSTMKISDGEICDNKAINKDETQYKRNQEGGGIAVCQGSELTIAGGKIHDNKAYRGGGIVVRGISSAIMNGEITVNEEDEVTSHDGSIYNNWAQNFGGGIYVYESDSADSYNSFTMKGGYIWHNECNYTKGSTSGGSGGAVYLRKNARFTLEGGRIEDNWAYNGGAIYTTESSVATISGGVLKDNYSGRHGGAIYNDYGTVNVQNGVFTDNYAKQDGGAIFNYGKVVTPFTFSVTGGTFTGNIGETGNGGALCSKGETADAGCGSVYISNGTFTGNAGKYGGGMAAIHCSVQLEGGTFKQNVSNRGGGLYVEACPTATISNIIVQENKCKNDDRIATDTYQFGGGMTIISKGTVCDVTINTGDFSKNSAPKGGGIMLYNHSSDVAKPATLTINGGTVNSNQALSGDGGGIHIDGGTYRSDTQQTKLTMNGGSINHNTASGNGGGVYVSNKGVALITTGTLNNQATHGEISQNTADNGGGVYVTTGANLSVVGGYITYNNASAPATTTLSKTGRHMLSNLHGTGGGICVTTSTDANAKSTFTLSAPTGTNNMAIYGNQATFSADDVFSNGSNTQLTVPTVQGMNMEEYGFAPEGWFEDYNTNDSQYYLGINMKGATAGSHKAIRYRNAVGKQRLHIEPLYVLGTLNDQSVPAGKSYVNMPDAYVAMTLGLPAAVDDTIVIDYSGSVNVNLYDNDLFITQDEFAGDGSYLMETLPTPDGLNVINKNYVYLSKGDLPAGSYSEHLDKADRHIASVYKGDGDTRGIITYSPKFTRPSTTARETWLSRTTADTFGYTVKHNGYWYYAKVTVVPATTLYFEDNATYITYHTDSTIEQLATWKPVKADEDDTIDEDYHPDEIAGAVDVYDVPSQDQDRPGYTGDTAVDQDNVYGNDTHYAGSYDFSNSSAHRVTVDRHASVNANNDKYCDVCGVEVAHEMKKLEGYGICAVCGKDHHCLEGDGGICLFCNRTMKHECVDKLRFIGYCDICGNAMTHTRNARASFTFTGTGFDLFSLCSAKTGIVMVNVFKHELGETIDFDDPPMDKDHYVTTYMVDTYYGYKEGDSTDNPSINLDSQAVLYQVPVIKADLTKVMTVMDDPNTEANEAQYKNWGYGTYTVEVYVAPSFVSSEHGYGSADFYLDAVRIYNPAVYGGITESNKDIVDVYMADGEAWPCYVEVRNMLLEQGDLDWDHATDDPQEGFVLIDGSKAGSVGTNDISTYRSFGPNNEVYLKQGQHIAFKLNLSNYGADVAGIQVGLKAISAPMVTSGYGSDPIEVTCSGMTEPLASVHLGTSEQYLDIGTKDANGNFLADGKVIVISNNNRRNIAITSIKITHNSEPDDYSRIKNVFESNMTTSWTAIEMINAKQLADPVMTPKYPALSYNGMICYNVFFSAEELGTLTADDLGLAVFDSYDPEGTVETAKDVIMGATEIDGLYMVETNGVHAKCLSDTQYFRAFAKKADGSYAYSKMVSYSALDYATNVLAKSDDVKLKQLVVAMLNYGAEAQKFFGYKTDDLMNKDLTADHQALLAGFDANSLNGVQKADPAKVGAFASTGGFASRYPAISFKGAFEINYFFTPANAVDGDMTLYIWNEDTYNSVTELTAENADKAVAMTLEDGAYTAASDEIFARQLDQTLYAAAVYESDGVTYCSGVLPYSIAAYCQKPPADVQALATAAAVYGCTAKQFFGE